MKPCIDRSKLATRAALLFGIAAIATSLLATFLFVMSVQSAQASLPSGDRAVADATDEFFRGKSNELGRIPSTENISFTATYLPFNVKEYPLKPPPVILGDFEQGTDGWILSQGALITYGTGLTATIPITYDNNKRARIGNPDLVDGSIPVGFGVISRTFEVSKRYLEVDYRIFSYDILQGSYKKYYDSLEVSLNTPPALISDTQREQIGCASTNLNPDKEDLTITPQSSGLIFCAGYPGPRSELNRGKLFATGWQTARVDLQAYLGEQITLYFALWSREYEPAYVEDHAYWNTWSFIDNILLTD